MIADETSNWHCLAVKSISGLLRGITSNHNSDFHCLNCIHSYTTEEKLRKYERICNDNDFCHSIMPDKKKKKSKIHFWRKIIKSSLYYLC